MLTAAHALNVLLMLALPLALGAVVARRFGASWALFGAGAVTFAASQAVHLPLNLGVSALVSRGGLPAPPAGFELPVTAVALGLSAGLCEELARFATYRCWVRGARSFADGVMLGAGHGGFESIALGVLAGSSLASLALLDGSDVAALPLAAEQQATLAAQVEAWRSLPPAAALVGAVERVGAMTIHLGLSILVLQAVARRRLAWLAAAVGWHATVDAVAVWTTARYSIWASEAAVGLFAVASVGIVLALRTRGGVPAERAPELRAPLPPVAGQGPRAARDPQDELRRKLDDSRFE